MTNATLQEIEELAKLTGLMSLAFTELIEDWDPDLPPLTVAFSGLADAFVDEYLSLSDDAKCLVFKKIELLVIGEEEVRVGVTTGFLEALVSHSEARLGGSYELFFDYLGEKSQIYIRDWLSFSDGQK